VEHVLDILKLVAMLVCHGEHQLIPQGLMHCFIQVFSKHVLSEELQRVIVSLCGIYI
jgi:hypothetical protein